MSKKWMGTTCLRAKPAGGVDTEAGVIRGVKVCSAGEAKGHGVHLDSDFIDAVVEQGAEYKRGLKARFGHPNMCSESLGTFVGRFQNFKRGETVREDGTPAACCFADLHLSETAQDAPGGDLHAYLLSMAENEADMFGTSIVFNPGKKYRRDKKTGEKVFRRVRETSYKTQVWYTREDGERLSKEEEKDLTDELFIECEKLFACDCVDEPAANDGLFSAFSGETVAGQITQFLDLNPQIFEILEQSPEIVEAVARYGSRFDQFLTRYKEYRTTATAKETNAMNEENAIQEQGQQVEQASANIETLTAEVVPGADVETAVKTALKADRARQAEIRELGTRFGFVRDAEQFAGGDQTVEQFRAHILAKSPEQWRESLAVKNPAIQESESEQLAAKEGDDAVSRIKEKRQSRFGSK
jgi:hypothetical protein